jgi:hypothetical protein
VFFDNRFFLNYGTLKPAISETGVTCFLTRKESLPHVGWTE